MNGSFGLGRPAMRPLGPNRPRTTECRISAKPNCPVWRTRCPLRSHTTAVRLYMYRWYIYHLSIKKTWLIRWFDRVEQWFSLVPPDWIEWRIVKWLSRLSCDANRNARIGRLDWPILFFRPKYSTRPQRRNRWQTTVWYTWAAPNYQIWRARCWPRRRNSIGRLIIYKRSIPSLY